MWVGNKEMRRRGVRLNYPRGRFLLSGYLRLMAGRDGPWRTLFCGMFSRQPSGRLPVALRGAQLTVRVGVRSHLSGAADERWGPGDGA